MAFDDSRRNEIGYEWLLMDTMPGTPAYYRRRRMSMAQEALTARVAEFQAQLFCCGNFGNGFRGIERLGTGLDRAKSRSRQDEREAQKSRTVSGKEGETWGESLQRARESRARRRAVRALPNPKEGKTGERERRTRAAWGMSERGRWPAGGRIDEESGEEK
jgi:hypothetical protein